MNRQPRAMNINRNNYEEFFVLYADNELSAAEKHLVESFVRENPDLQREFSLLQQTKIFSDDSIVFEDKELLMSSRQDNNSVINHSNYEEFFLLYVDNELNEENKKAVEEFAAWHPSLQLELILLQKVRLTPDSSVVFEGKEKLYREEPKRILLFRWQSIAAAAIVLVLAGLLVFKYTSTKHIPPVVAVESKNDDQTKKDQSTVTSAPSDSLNIRSGAKEMALEKKKEEKKSAADVNPEQKNKLARNESSRETANPTQQKEPVKPENDIAPIIAIEQGNDRESQINTDKIDIRPDAVATINLKTQDVPQKNPTTDGGSLIKQVAIVDQTGNPESPNSFLAFSTKKNKMRGIFRRVSRVFEKTTSVDSDKPVLIGNFQIALK